MKHFLLIILLGLITLSCNKKDNSPKVHTVNVKIETIKPFAGPGSINYTFKIIKDNVLIHTIDTSFVSTQVINYSYTTTENMHTLEIAGNKYGSNETMIFKVTIDKNNGESPLYYENYNALTAFNYIKF